MDHKPVEITRIIRRLRGKSQAHLVSGSDGHFYAAKFTGNPEGTRTLINEWFVHQLLRRLRISTPPLRVLQLTRAVSGSLVFAGEGGAPVRVEPGLHLGSQYPVNPVETTIFDFLPRPFLGRVVNRKDFAQALVLDLLVAQADTRQAVFVRERSGTVPSPFRAYLIDQGGTLGGSAWNLPDGPSSGGLCWDRSIYSMFDLHAECEPALHLLTALTREEFDRLGEGIPEVWFAKTDHPDWARLLDQLWARKNQLPRLWLDHVKTLPFLPPGAIAKEHAGPDDRPTAREPQRPRLALLA
jgi:hypothetical protein